MLITPATQKKHLKKYSNSDSKYIIINIPHKPAKTSNIPRSNSKTPKTIQSYTKHERIQFRK